MSHSQAAVIENLRKELMNSVKFACQNGGHPHDVVDQLMVAVTATANLAGIQNDVLRSRFENHLALAAKVARKRGA